MMMNSNTIKSIIQESINQTGKKKKISIHSKNDTEKKKRDPPFTRRIKLRKLYNVNQFLYKSDDIEWYCKESYKDRIYALYRDDIEFRMKLNNWKVYGKTSNKKLKKIIAQVIKQHENIIMQANSLRRQGKSRVSRSFILRYAKIWKKNIKWTMIYNQKPFGKALELVIDDSFQEWMNVYVTFSIFDTMAIAKELKAGDFILEDEGPRTRGDGSINISKDFDNLFNISSGKRRLNFFQIKTYEDFYHEIDYYLKVLATNREHKYTLCMLFTALFEKNRLKKVIWVGVVKINVNEPPELTDWYEPLSDKIKQDIQEKSGQMGIGRENKQEYIDMIIDLVQKNKKRIKTRRQLESLARDIDEIRMIPSSKLFDDIITDALPRAKRIIHDSKHMKYFVGNDDFRIDIDKFIDDHEDDTIKNLERDKEIFKYYYHNYNLISQEKIAHDYQTTQQNIQAIIKRFRGSISFNMGKLYEEFRVKQIREEEGHLIESIKNEGQKPRGLPDIEIKYKDGSYKIISCKCRISWNNTETIYTKEMKPEIETVQKLIKSTPADTKIEFILDFFDYIAQDVYNASIDDIMFPPKKLIIHLDKR